MLKKSFFGVLSGGWVRSKNRKQPKEISARFFTSGELRLFLTAVFFVAGGGLINAVHAQSATATLSGTVVDANNAVVAGVNITVTNPATAHRRQIVSDDEGAFIIAQLQPGVYSVQATRDGFAPVNLTDIALNVNDQRSLKIQLQPASVGAQVNVETEASLIDTAPSVSTTIDRRFVENLPLNGRSFQSLIALTPGVVPTNGAGQFSVNGQRDNANYFTIDGVSANVGIGDSRFKLGQSASGSLPGFNAQGATNSLISIDALQEFKIQTSTYAAEFGRQPGGQVQLVTRSGTNQFSGSVFEYFRNEALDANDFFTNARPLTAAQIAAGETKQPRPPRRQHDFGGVIGGPVFLPRFGEGTPVFFDGRNRTFFFFSYEQLRLKQPQLVSSAVPSLRFRQTGAASLQPYLNAQPLPTGPETLRPNGMPTGGAPFVAIASNPQRLNATSVRIDHTASDKLTLFGRYNYAPSKFSQRAFINIASLRTRSVTPQTLTLGATNIFNSNTTNELRFNFSRTTGENRSVLDTFGGAVPVPDSLLFPPALASSGSSLVNLTIEERANVGFSSRFEVGRTAENEQRQINVVDNFAVIRGSHNLKFGVDYRRLFPLAAPADYQLLATIRAVPLNPAVPPNAVNSGSITTREQLSLVFNNLSLYAQDSWKITRRLTLDYGLRYELNPPPTAGGGKKIYPLVGTESLATIRLDTTGEAPLYPTKYNNFAPRVGAAYQLFDKPGRETVLRGGFGIFYDLGAGTAGDIASFFPFVRTRDLPFNVGFFDLTNAQLTAPPVALSLQPPYNNDRFLGFAPDYELPRVRQFSFSIEQSLGKDQSITASFVGSQGRKLLRREVVYDPNTQFFLSPNDPRYFAPAVVFITRNESESDYNALQLQYQRRLSRGLQAIVSYTFAKSIDNVSFDNAEFGTALTIVNPQGDRGPSDFDVRHSLSAAVTYNIPFPNTGKIGNAIFRGFSIDTIVNARTATPVDIYYTRNAAAFSLFRPDLVPGVPLYLDDPTTPGGRRFNRAAFFVPRPEQRQGNLGRNALRGQPFNQVDLTARRQFKLTDRMNLQLRAEFFNVFNRTNLANQIGRLGNLGSNNTTFNESPTMFGRSLTTLANQPADPRLDDGGTINFNPLYRSGGARSIQLAVKLNF